ncbi:MAG TPA: TetR family transcriptional regulator [Streptomyces sp.]|uniref:TetR/AcrR family transcriptional regulator n=1 Tax=Streptomyces sp. TaxID=1931 RepID=UPI002D4F84B9|nr:TetR family transcriptional regulator [Streptomyces sp.]HZG06216.1 TetR family transcriptional regulator [Streptomyces sp.]
MEETPQTQSTANVRDDAPTRKRRRAPEAHRAAILEAARAAFAERGFAKATIRDVARRAGVTHGLVMRHFTSKERLFLAALPGPRDLVAEVAGDPATLPERIARTYVDRMARGEGCDPFVALVRSVASDEEAAKRLFTAMREQSLEVYRGVMPGPDWERRVESVGAYLIGVTFSRYVLGSGPLAEMPEEELVRHLASDLRGIVFPPAEAD